MPQMSPMNWTSLMFMFIITIIMMISVNYFINTFSHVTDMNITNKKKSNYWKW